MTFALFGIEDGSLNLAVNLLILVLVVFWLALVYWTWADARRRVSDPVLITTATVLSLVVPFIGTVIYTILRPPEFLADAREREVETQASELRMRHLTVQSCPRCEHPIERTWLRCPDCQHRLKDPCRSCSRPVDPRWSICPYCETPLRRSEKSRSRSRGEADSKSDAPPRRKSPAERVKRDATGERSSRPPAKPKSSKSQKPSARAASDSNAAPDGDGGESAARPRRRSTTTS
jgi:hypothetical protein